MFDNVCMKQHALAHMYVPVNAGRHFALCWVRVQQLHTVHVNAQLVRCRTILSTCGCMYIYMYTQHMYMYMWLIFNTRPGTSYGSERCMISAF